MRLHRCQVLPDVSCSGCKVTNIFQEEHPLPKLNVMKRSQIHRHFLTKGRRDQYFDHQVTKLPLARQ